MLLLIQIDWRKDIAKRAEPNSSKILFYLLINAPSSWRIDAVQIVVEAAQNVVNQLQRSRSCAGQKPYCRPSCRLHDGKGSELLLTLLPQCTPREGSARCSSSKAQHSGNVKNHKELNCRLTWMLLVHTDRGGCPEGAVFLFNYAHKRY